MTSDPPEQRALSLDDAKARLTDWLGALHKAETFNGTVLIAKDGDRKSVV